MTKKKQKLELTWIGKDQRPKLEPRILIEDPEKSYHASERRSEDDIFDNMLIHGDNLLALKALEQDYAGKVKCVYIDPPFNINASTPYFDDGLEHSQWLNLMRPRLELLKMLLSPDGMIFVHIDDEEMPYLTVLMDQIFGRSNRINIIAVKMSEPSGVKMAHIEKRLPKLKEFILVYSGGGCHTINVEKVPIGTWNEEYKTILLGIDKHLRNTTTISLAEYFKNNRISKKDQKNFSFENAWRIIQAVGSNSVFNMAKSQRLRRQKIAAVLSSTGIIYLYKTDFDKNAKQPRVQIIFADENLTQNPGDFWQDIRTTGGVGKEGGVLFPNSKKPESLLKRIVGLSTGPGDTVLDSFAGSGRTGAVAHKMKRKWIMVEMGDHCETHIMPRMKSIINDQDRTGITEKVSWSGGGGFRYFHLASSLLEQDKYGNWVISKDYKPEMLAEAMCKHMGFTYAPSQNPDEYWTHGYSTETDFIFQQMKDHYWETPTDYRAKVTRGFRILKAQNFNVSGTDRIRDLRNGVTPRSNIGKYVFNGLKKCGYPYQKFDSDDERCFAVLIDGDFEKSVRRWIKPGARQFQIEYGSGQAYEPDFVVETDTEKLIVEIKARNEMDDEIVLAKARAAAEWVKYANEHADANGGKPWSYLLIPGNAITESATLAGLAAAQRRE